MSKSVDSKIQNRRDFRIRIGSRFRTFIFKILRELRDLAFFHKSFHNSTDLNVNEFVTFVSHGRSCSLNPSIMLKPACCTTSTFQAIIFIEFLTSGILRVT